MTRLHLVVRGRVQGVGFRWFVREQAEERSLAGWVRNLRDGSVELEVEGPTKIVEEFVAAIRTQHSFAKVDDMKRTEISPQNAPGFEIR